MLIDEEGTMYAIGLIPLGGMVATAKLVHIAAQCDFVQCDSLIFLSLDLFSPGTRSVMFAIG